VGEAVGERRHFASGEGTRGVDPTEPAHVLRRALLFEPLFGHQIVSRKSGEGLVEIVPAHGDRQRVGEALRIARPRGRALRGVMQDGHGLIDDFSARRLDEGKLQKRVLPRDRLGRFGPRPEDIDVRLSREHVREAHRFGACALALWNADVVDLVGVGWVHGRFL
jgi:hypothetical protein